MTMSFHRLIKPAVFGMQNVFHGPLIGTGIGIGMMKQYHDIPCQEESETEPFSLLVRRPRKNLVYDRWRSISFSPQVLGPGIVLFKNYLTLMGQVDILNICQEGAMGPAGFYRPCNPSGDELRLRMMCYGRNWDPITKYEKRFRSDGSEPPPLPYEFISLAENAVQDAQGHLDELPSMCPDICIANAYPYMGRIGLHQDCDESADSIRRGLPVVSASIGSSAEFLYGHTKDENKLDKVLLESGDVLVFGGKSRLIFHGIRTQGHNSIPHELMQQALLSVFRLNLTLRQV